MIKRSIEHLKMVIRKKAYKTILIDFYKNVKNVFNFVFIWKNHCTKCYKFTGAMTEGEALE
jgi:hypothetical protein